MRKVLFPLVVGLITPTLVAGSASASYDDRRPDQFLYTTVTLNPGDRLSYRFDNVAHVTLPFTSLVAADVTGPDGAPGPSSFGAQYFDDHAALEVRADTTHRVVTRTTDPRGCCFGSLHAIEFHGTVAPGSTGRFAFASWGGAVGVHLSLNGVAVPLSGGDPRHAFVASALDFNGGAAALVGESDVGGLSSFTRDSRGHLFALFLPGDIGVGRVTEPASNAQVIGPSLAGFEDGLRFAQQTNGTWTYSLDGEKAALADGAPILWGMEVP